MDLEEKLASQGSLNPKEEKLHKLIKVELGERRGVEEIGLVGTPWWSLQPGRLSKKNFYGLTSDSFFQDVLWLLSSPVYLCMKSWKVFGNMKK